MPAPHPPEFRRMAVELAREREKPIGQIAILHRPVPARWTISIVTGPEMSGNSAVLYRKLVENSTLYPSRCATTARAATGSPSRD